MAETTANEIQNEITTGSSRTGIMTRTGGAISELRRMANQPAVKRAMPAGSCYSSYFCWFNSLSDFTTAKQDIPLYASLPESEKSKIPDALMNSGIDATIDPTTGDVMVPVPDYHNSKNEVSSSGFAIKCSRGI